MVNGAVFKFVFLVCFVVFSFIGIVSGACIDPDGGQNFDVQSAAHIRGFNSYQVDKCYNSTSVREYYCTEHGAINNLVNPCEFGCYAGACLAEEDMELSDERHFNLCFDSDGGSDLDTQGILSFRGTFSRIDSCIDEDNLREYSCNNIGGKIEPCEFGCSAGACLPDPGPIHIDCIDENLGKDINVKSEVNYLGSIFEDSCSDFSNLTEFFCKDNDVISTENIACEFGCFDGACIAEEILQCVDSDVDLFDEKGREVDPLGVKGEINFLDQNFEDFCATLGTVNEYSCEAEGPLISRSGCVYGCSKGKCNTRTSVESSIDSSGLLGWYTFDEDDVNFRGLDSSINFRTLSRIGSVVMLTKDENPAPFFFDGGYIPLSEDSFPKYPEGFVEAEEYDLTFSVWFKTLGSGVILGQAEKDKSSGLPPNIPSSGAVPAVYIDKNGKLRVTLFWDGLPQYNVVERYVSESKVNDDMWHNVVATVTNGTEIIYLDGLKVHSRERVVKGYASRYTYTLGIGYAQSWDDVRIDVDWNEWFNYVGFMDKVAIFDRALSDYEAKQLFSEGRGSFIASPEEPDEPEESKDEEPEEPSPQPPSSGGNSGGGSGGGGGSSSGGGGSSSGGGSIISGRAISKLENYILNESEFNFGFTGLLKSEESVQFVINGAEHYVKVLKLNIGNIDLEVSANPKAENLGVEKTKGFDVLGDGFYDFSVSLNNIVGDKVNLSVISLQGKGLGSEPEYFTIPSPEEKESDDEEVPTVFGFIGKILKNIFWR